MRNNNELKENVSKSAFLIGLLIEISVCLVGFLLQALLIEVGLKYFCYIIFGIMFIYFMGRNYFFISFSSAILGIRWKKNRLGRTLATRAIDKGMPIEQVQVLLGHSKIDTTLKYANVEQKNVRYSHQKYIC